MQRSFESIDLIEPEVEGNSFAIPYGENDSPEEAAMDAIKEGVLKQKRFVNHLDSATFISLPVGLSYNTDTLADPNYFIIIDEATIYPQYAEFSAFMSLKNPIDGQIIRFRANHIKFSFKSGLINGFNLELVSEIKTKLSEESYLYWMPGSFVDWDCNGFKSLGINAKIELNKDKYIKVDPRSGKEQGRVSTTCFIAAAGLNDILMELSFDPFKLKGFDEAYFSFQKITLDFSESYNASGFKLPTNYPGGYTGEMANLWKGFYVQEAQVFLNKKFNGRDSVSTSFFAKDLILDDFGLTGDIGVENLLSYDKGRLGNWKMSVSHFELSFFTGDFVSLGLNGGVIVEGIDEPMVYEAFYDVEGNYHFGINPGKDIGFSVFSAKVNLKATSRIDVWVEQGKFMPAATLDGEISFTGSKKPGVGKALIKIPYVKFEGLHIATKAPVFGIKSIALVSSSDNSNFNKFPITISDVGFENRKQNKAVFSFTLKVNLVPTGDLGIEGETHVGIVASINKGDWKYAGLELSSLSVEASVKGSFSIKGKIQFADGDATYGDGFRGRLDATFIEKFEMSAVVVFGKVNGYRYFFVDTQYRPTPYYFVSPFFLTGFSGGVYYRMKQATDGGGTEFGESLSGIKYVPDKNTSLGIKAGMTAAIFSESLIKCEAEFSIAFTSSFGIARIAFRGEGSVLNLEYKVSADRVSEITKNAVEGKSITLKIKPPLSVSISMLMDFQNKSFHSEMEMFLNVAGAIKGTGENNKAGWGVMHIDPDKWYLHLGTPTDPLGVNFIGLMEVDSYFMAGHDIPDAMMMNQRVLAILNMNQSDFNGERQEGDLMTGKGLAFGAHIELDTGDLTFLIFYARFELGGGFDIMLLDYGPNVYCKGHSGSPGINGWFAKGQAYAYFAGKIGIKVRIFGRKKKFDIINLQAAAAIRIEGPNPTWMKGAIGGSYRILGGMISGKCKFEMTLGEKCEMRTMQDLSDLEIIADLTPAHESEDVDIFALPQAVFNMPVDKVLTISEDPELTKTFKINLVEYSVYTEDGTKYPGEIEWNEDKTSLGYRMHEIFYSNSTYKIVAKVSFDEKVNGKWQPYKGDDGKVYYETKEATFKTGALPEKIPDDAIAYSYPIDRMVNFYKEEYNKAYVAFNPGVAAFFEHTEGYTQKARWTQVNGEPTYSSLKYNKESRTVEADVPGGLNNDKVYRFDLVHVPISDDASVDRNITENVEQALNGEDENSAEITTREAEGVINNGEAHDFYGLDFRVSKYNKFLDKFPQSSMNIKYLSSYSAGIDLLVTALNGDEMFGTMEIRGTSTRAPLITCEAILEGADWYRDHYANYIYNDDIISMASIVNWRTTSEYGLPPTKPVDFWQYNGGYVLSQEDFDNGNFRMNTKHTNIVYVLPKIWAKDFRDIKNSLAYKISQNQINTSKNINEILNNYLWPRASVGSYPVKFSYVLPGINRVTSSKKVVLKNSIRVSEISKEETEILKGL